MGSRNFVFVLFMLCAILSSIEGRPSKHASTEAGNQITHQNAGTQVDKQSNNIRIPFGNDIMMRGKPKTKDMDKAIKYMYKYGYMPVPSNPGAEMPEMTPDNVKENIKKMQMMMGLPMTGTLDSSTMEMIGRPRCGVHDPVDVMIVPIDANRNEILQLEVSPNNFVHYGQKWPRNNITYRILNFPYMLNHNDTYTSIRQAFQVWSDVTPLTFTERVAGYADIYLKFGRYEHGDPYPFDGRGGTLAHAFLPQINNGNQEGDVHFDDDEYFTYQSYQGINLFYVAAHEIGHALGLQHSFNPDALLAPFINPYDPDFTLHPDDIAGIQDLYGAAPTTANPNAPSTFTQSTTNKNSVTTLPPPSETSSLTKRQPTTPSLPPPSDPTDTEYSSDDDDDYAASWSFLFDSSSSSESSADYPGSPDERCPLYHTLFTNNDVDFNTDYDMDTRGCRFYVDAVASYRGEIFAFKGSRYWRVTKDYISPVNGDEATYFFESFPNNIDAAYEEYDSSKLFVFKGSDYYVYNGTRLESGPQPISNLDPSLPSDVDAVLTWGDWKKTYFFKDDLVWRFDERSHVKSVDYGWPWRIKEIWTGVPNYLTSAFRWGEYSYFLQGNQLYAYDDTCYYVNPRSNPKSFAQEFLNGSCPV